MLPVTYCDIDCFQSDLFNDDSKDFCRALSETCVLVADMAGKYAIVVVVPAFIQYEVEYAKKSIICSHATFHHNRQG